MSSYSKFAGHNCLDPEDLQQFTERDALPDDYYGKANSYRCPLGSDPGEGWVLLANKKLREIERNEFHALELVDDDSGTVTIRNLMIERAYSMAARARETDDQPMLVHLVDKRWLLAHLTSTGSSSPEAGDHQYNVRYPYGDVDGEQYYDDSLNASSPWTWEEVFQDLWNALPSGLDMGDAPSLPFSPHGTPENFRFLGVSIWRAIEQLLAKIHCAIAYDPIDEFWDVVRLGQTQSGLSNALSELHDKRNYDFHPVDSVAARIPEKIRVFFPRRSEDWGLMHDQVRDGNLAMKPYYSVDVPTSADGAIGGTLVALWDDMAAVYDSSDTLTNSSELTARANEIAGDYAATLEESDSSLRRHFNGYHETILPGSQIKAVIWRDYGDGFGPITEVIRDRGLHKHGPEAWGRGRRQNERAIVPGSAEQLHPPDFGRSTLLPPAPMLGKTTADHEAGDIDDNYIILKGRVSDDEDAGISTVPPAEFTVDIEDGTPIILHFVNGLWLAEPLMCEAPE